MFRSPQVFFNLHKEVNLLLLTFMMAGTDIP
jgi:hypothetical protein